MKEASLSSVKEEHRQKLQAMEESCRDKETAITAHQSKVKIDVLMHM